MDVSALTYPVPAHANSLWYTLGGITFIGFVVLILTGIYLAQFYHPHPAQARDSVLYIRAVAPLGDLTLVRGVHVWLASLVTITAFLHLLRVFATGSYKRPREVNWLVGVALLAVTWRSRSVSCSRVRSCVGTERAPARATASRPTSSAICRTDWPSNRRW